MSSLLKLVPTPESERVFPAHQVDLKAVRAHLRQLAAVAEKRGWTRERLGTYAIRAIQEQVTGCQAVDIRATTMKNRIYIEAESEGCFYQYTATLPENWPVKG